VASSFPRIEYIFSLRTGYPAPASPIAAILLSWIAPKPFNVHHHTPLTSDNNDILKAKKPHLFPDEAFYPLCRKPPCGNKHHHVIVAAKKTAQAEF
jgi:hypothetical protein